MKNSFFKKTDGTWAIAMIDSAKSGDVVTVTLKSGATKQITLGAFIASNKMRPPNGDEYFVHCFEIAKDAAKAPASTVAVGSLSGILAMIDKAASYMKQPAIVLAAPAGFPTALRISRAGSRARFPGTLDVKGADKDGNEDFGRAWYGRISLDGVFMPGRDCSNVEAVAEALRRFAADPVGVASAYGTLTGKCCFCMKALGLGKDKRSVAVGYGPDCADHFGLPWGVKHSFTCEPVDAARKEVAA